MPPTTDEVIARFSPVSVPPEAVAFARRVVARAGPQRAQRAKALLFAAGKLGAFAASVGLELDEGLLTDSVIERFVLVGCLGGPATRRTVRTNLRALRRAVLAGVSPQPTPLPRGRAKPPYTRAQIAGFLALCDAQPTRLRQGRAAALVCLGAGAGLYGRELRGVRGSDVVARSGGILVLVAGRGARSVPVLAPFGERLATTAHLFGERYLVAGGDPDSHNVTNPIIRSLSGGKDLPRLDAGRLRSTYLAQMAATIGLRAFMDAAGLTCSQRLGDIVASLDAPSEAEAVALLTPRRRE
jgi:integrase